MNWNDFDAALFDLDGVLTPTAELHQHAWSRLFSGLLADYPEQAPYTEDDYFAYVDGRPRYDGVAAFLGSRGIEVPWGTPADEPTSLTVCGLGNLKNAEFEAMLASEGLAPYPGSLRLVEHLAARGIAMAVVSSSKNAPDVLDRAGLSHFFPVVVDGRVAEDEGVPGKPAPDMYLRAADKLGVQPHKAVVLEDALSGVQSGRAGSFGRVVGVNRGVGQEALLAHGADLVVDDLEELL